MHKSVCIYAFKDSEGKHAQILTARSNGQRSASQYMAKRTPAKRRQPESPVQLAPRKKARGSFSSQAVQLVEDAKAGKTLAPRLGHHQG